MYDYATRNEQIQIHNELTNINENMGNLANTINTTLTLIAVVLVFNIVHNIVKYITWRR